MPRPSTGAEALLFALKDCGVAYLFANSGTDFPPVIEALAAHPGSCPIPVTIPHESAAVAMAHGYCLASGRPQAVMVHVNVGLANAAMGAINAASDNVPVILMSGRTPLTEHARPGARVSQIQYGQEMFDQTSLVREATKFNYELRYAEQAGQLATRAHALALSEPRGPVYLSLPREPLTEAFPADHHWPPAPQAAPGPVLPDPAAIAEAAALLAAAERPLVVCQRGDLAGALAPALEALGLPVIEPFTVRSVLPAASPVFAGYSPDLLKKADVILTIDSPVPWIERLHRPTSVKVIALGPDPLFGRAPVRSFQTDFSLSCDPARGIEALARAVIALAPDHSAWCAECAPYGDPPEVSETSPITGEYLSRAISDILGDGRVFTELGVTPEPMRLTRPNQLFTAPHSGGLGWALPAALGAALHDRHRLTIAAVGDGSYMFANPVACHQIAEAHGLPVLTIIKNNASWNAVRRAVTGAYPEGVAVRANVMPLTSLAPMPDFCAIARASRAHAERVEAPEDLSPALERAVRIIGTEGRQVLLDVAVQAGSNF